MQQFLMYYFWQYLCPESEAEPALCADSLSKAIWNSRDQQIPLALPPGSASEMRFRQRPSLTPKPSVPSMHKR